jgi:hypothetical protein
MKKYPRLCSYLSIINHGIIINNFQKETKAFTLHFYTIIIISSIQNCRSSVSFNTVCNNKVHTVSKIRNNRILNIDYA